MGSSPKPPDPYQTAAAQTQADVGAGQASAIINNANQYGPWGSRTYNQAGWETVYGADGKAIKVPRYNEVTQLSPDQMRLYGLNTQTQYNLGQTGVEQSARLRDMLGKTIDTKGLQGWQAARAPGQITGQIGAAGDIRQDQAPTDRAAVERAMLGRFDTDAARQAAQQDAQLAARGMAPGSAMYGSVDEARRRGRTDAVQQAYLASGQEARQAQQAYNAAQQQRFGQAAQRAEFGNTAAQLQYQLGSDWAAQMNALRQGQLQERLAMRNQPINEITALLGGSQVQSPQFQPFSRQGINAPPLSQLVGQNYAAQQQNYANQMSGLFGLGSAGVMGLFGL